MRFIHTADWQIGLKGSHVAHAAEAVREARLQAARSVVAEANRARVEAVVLAGDTFEDNLVGDSLVRRVVEILAACEAPVFVLPGNHDPLSEDSVFRRASFRERPAHVVLLESNDAVPVPGADAVLLPAPCRKKKSFEDPTKGLRAPAGGAVAIGVGHGSLRIDGKFSADDFPIALDAARRSELDYLALGHWHGSYVHEERTVYPGSHEPTRFGEERSGQALLVEIAARGAPPKRTTLTTGQLRWETLELDLSSGAEPVVQDLRGRASKLAEPKRVLWRVRTAGRAAEGAEEPLRRLEEELSEKLLYFELERGDLPAAQAQGRLAEIAADSALVTGLLEELGKDAAPHAVQARRLLEDLALEVWR